MNWEELTEGKAFITDMGANQEIEDWESNETIVLERYAAWVPLKDSGKHCIVEVSDDPNYLRKKYNIDTHEIFQLI